MSEAKPIALLDYGMGNVLSVKWWLRRNKFRPYMLSDIDDLYKKKEFNGIKNIIIPGVGSFDNGIKKLNDCGFNKNSVRDLKIGIIGICLGAQVMMESSEEGKLEGWGIRKGHCIYMGRNESRQGWYKINSLKPMRGINTARVYFNHSYKMQGNNSDLLFVSNNVESMWKLKKYVGIQFHPEKSQVFSKKFAQLVLN